MNTYLNIKTRRPLFSSIVVTLLVGVVGMLLLGCPSAQAQTATTAPPASTPAVVDSSITLSASGTVNDPSGAITFKGSVIVNCRRVIDTTGVSPALVVLDLDFSKLQGTAGSLKLQKVYITGDNHAAELRPLQVSDTIIVTCPYYDSTKDVLSASSMLVTATLNFDTSTGKLTSGSINVGNNVVTSAAVGNATM
ncbi:MAG TPA: hypothetical protein VJ875_13675 [Pyrinomonadaceae bacterium]|nr:hypothetical protein [Pyrinomonadaceae bacterium]